MVFIDGSANEIVPLASREISSRLRPARNAASTCCSGKTAALTGNLFERECQRLP